ncbi:hypothetical protein J7E79_10240 [Bacillus sp. ISL-40]|jgi:hypothetical protein|uniref:DUF4391 domain-containing protein n=1 Tax=Priestia megaterium TaxID=1404 RepID=A0A6H1P976_PRIMG|nr:MULTISPECIES: DUF4391 domain-containing protein [Bacillaceae]MBT2697790.1 hypothetical protein [Bacillus sp. ISL-40]MBT2721621.1 hypothetical protein [Bacillus sp. ISL-46]MBT2726953.1 hypothetical protein [Bacillus sp. ISL-75]QIZ10174.1 DUF4391 domain-containing protein [Priestia megaterium]
MKEYFSFDDRLGIQLPDLTMELADYSIETQEEILLYWEQVRGSIPDRIGELEIQINQKQALLSNESNFPRSCQLNTEIAELASIINDLWLWYRANEVLSTKVHQ